MDERLDAIDAEIFYGEKRMMMGDMIFFLAGSAYHSSVNTGLESVPRDSIEARICLKGVNQESKDLLNELFGIGLI